MDIPEIAGKLAHSGYIVLEKPLDDALLNSLLARCKEDVSSGFQTAHIGKGADKKQISSIRGDVISWLIDTHSTDAAYLALMEKLRLGLNERLFLGLFDYECHYAIYREGTGYAKHTDVLAGKKNRVLSTVLYLNEDWQPGDGGELMLYDAKGAALETVAPRYGTMIIFLSESFPHEVLISQRIRRSIAGWFRVSGS
jgi:SM-20-related protein